jgi:hypothetical protein
MTWAAGRRWGGCSGRATIYAIANHANDLYFCYARQETLATESEQSTDSVGRRIAEFVADGQVRRIKLKRFGRRTHDFLILAPSPYFAAPLAEIEPYLPRGCGVMADEEPHAPPSDAAADCGSAAARESAGAQADAGDHAAANCGCAEAHENAATLPQPAGDAAALVRQQEPILEPENSPPQTPPRAGDAGRGKPDGSAREGSESAGKTGSEPWRELFTSAFSQYPQHQLDNRKRAAEEFAKLSQADRELVDRVVGPFARDIAAAKRKPPAMWKWLRDRRFAAYGPDGASAPRAFVAEGSPAWTAWTNVARVAFGADRLPHFWAALGPNGERGVHVPSPAPWPLGGEAWLTPLDAWVFVEAGTAQWRRWVERTGEILKRVPLSRRATPADRSRSLFARGNASWGDRAFEGLLVPSQWPPAKGAASATGPPGSSVLMTDDDWDCLAKG